MKILFIGGTGTISLAISRRLAESGHELFLFNRGNKNTLLPDAVHLFCGDIHDEADAARLLEGHSFDVAADFIAFEPSDIERDFRLFRDKARQFIFISSASAYQKPPVHYIVTESTPLSNPYWRYSRMKIDCEELLMNLFRSEGFPVTIVRPSHTYAAGSVPLALHGAKGPWQILSRMRREEPVIIPGDGSSLWTATHSDDFARGFIGLMANPHAIGHAVHITGDEVLSWTQIHEIVAAALGVRLNPLYIPATALARAGKKYGYDFEGSLLGDKAHSAVFDNTKLKRLVPGFAAAKRFDQGVAESISYLLSHPERQIEDSDFEIFCDEVSRVYSTAAASFPG